MIRKIDLQRDILVCENDIAQKQKQLSEYQDELKQLDEVNFDSDIDNEDLILIMNDLIPKLSNDRFKKLITSELFKKAENVIYCYDYIRNVCPDWFEKKYATQ